MASRIVSTFSAKKIIIALVLILIATIAFGQSLPTPNSCTSPNALNPIQLIGSVYTQWNCWLQDYVYLYFLRTGVNEQQSAIYANQAVQADSVNRLDAALRDLRQWDQPTFDRVFADHGLQLK
jgi:hypothetical protein